ncbi:hypothetical protein R1sor_018984 [Riccia sorocarpa]|uniref:Uncharacterized protein n=1 Tax=Riccia sorocarpa TaxID=122646 RepID=A0ABD3IFG4_9MARC
MDGMMKTHSVRGRTRKLRMRPTKSGVSSRTSWTKDMRGEARDRRLHEEKEERKKKKIDVDDVDTHNDDQEERKMLTGRKLMVGAEYFRLRLAPSPYRRKLAQEVLKKLQKALDVPTQRPELLRQLFTDVALEVDSRARARLYEQDDNSPRSVVDNGISPKFKYSGRPLCFYEVLAEHYVQVPEDAKEVLPLFLQLWSQSFASQIFTLLLYQWLFEVPSATESDGYLRYSTAFVEGASNIFWIDLQSNEQRFFPLYHYALEEVVTNRKPQGKVTNQAQRDLVLMMSRFFFFYEPAVHLEKLLGHFPPFPGSATPSDLFVIELTDQLQTVKVEPVLIKYLECTKILKGVELRVTTSTRLKTALYSFTSPGGPLYPTRPVRHAAWETLDYLFPIGRTSRHLISLGFRLMHPYYWPMSFLHFLLEAVVAFFGKVYAVLLRIWHTLFGPGQVPH